MQEDLPVYLQGALVESEHRELLMCKEEEGMDVFHFYHAYEGR